MDDDPDRAAGAEALDFWIGDWACSWEGGHGRNRISRELDGRVIVERFESVAPERLSGMSLSVLHEGHGWRQTWVDSTGNYWAFTGGPHPEGFLFTTTEVEDGREVEKRMVFSDIGPEGLTWRWERSRGGGRTWEVLWRIDYRRAARKGQERQGTGRSPPTTTMVMGVSVMGSIFILFANIAVDIAYAFLDPRVRY
jgi:hypothetical protein